MGLSYESAGVSRAFGDEASRMMYEAAQQTWHNRHGRLGEVLVPFDDFSGLRAIDISGLPQGTLLNLGFDGIGTKVELAERMGQHETMAFDLFAMVCDDAVIRGAEPVLIGSILDLNALADRLTGDDFLSHIGALADGYVRAAAAAGVAVVNGEIAELGERIGGFGPFRYNWGAAVLWFARKERLLTGAAVRPGDVVVGLREEGFRSNGLSLVRRVLSSQHGDEWHRLSFHKDTLGDFALRPSRIYTRAVVSMTGGFQGEPGAQISGAAHITGGGLPGKLGRLLKASGFGARLDSPCAPSALMLACQEWGDVSDEEAYQTWNMGQGMVIVAPEQAVADVLRCAEEHGHEGVVIGEIVEAPGISIQSRGHHRAGEWLHFGAT